MATDHNQLIQKDFIPIRGWVILIFLAVMALLLVPAVWLLHSHGKLAILAAFFAAGLLAAVVAVAPMGGAALPALGLRRADWRFIVLGALGAPVLSVAVSQIGLELEAVKEVAGIVQEPGQLIAGLVVMAGLAPLVEELIFRGLLYGWLAGRWGSRVAVVVSSLAFAAAHYEPAHVLLVLPLAFLFGWLRRRTDSLLPSLVAHVANNCLAVLAAAFLGD